MMEAKMITLFLVIVIIAVVAVIAVQNAMPVAITFLFWKFEASLAIVIFLSLLCGIIAGSIAVSLLRMRTGSKDKKTA
jgi:uncharacterized integral membrane protein